MLKKIYNSKIKVFFIFLAFIFLSSLVFLSLKILEYRKIFNDNEVNIVERIDKDIDFGIEKIFVKFTQYRNDEFIKGKDRTKEINSKREKDKINVEEDIEYTKENIKEKKQELSENNEQQLSKEKIAEEIKKLDENQKQEIENISNRLKKTDGEYWDEIIAEELNNKTSIEEAIEKIGSFKYFIIDNKSRDFDTNSTYGKTNIEEKFFYDSRYAVKFISQDKSAETVKEYIDGKSVESSNYVLSNTRKNIKENDVTLYLWVPNNSREIKYDYLRELIEKQKDNKNLYKRYEKEAMASVVLLALTLAALLCFRKKKIELKCEIYNKVHHDLFIVALLIISVLYSLKSGLFFFWGMIYGYDLYMLNPGILILGGGILGTILVTYISFIKKKNIKQFFKKGIFISIINKSKAMLEVKDIVFKMFMVFIVICLQIIAICIQFMSGGFRYYFIDYSWVVLPVIFIVVDGFIFYILTKKLIYFKSILDGTKLITNGDLGLVLEEKGKGNLSQLAHNINNMKLGLKNSLEKEMKSEKMKSELITNVSHDLKTPLTSIINYVDLLKKEELTPEKANDYVEILDRKSKRLKHLVEDLFEASKAASGAMELNIERIEITELMKQTLAEIEDKILKSTLDFRVNLGKEKVYAMVDGKRTYRVFENLVQNVLKYSMKHSRVYIDLIQEDGTKKFIIKNMSSYEMNFDADEIAERFKRGDVSRSTEGSGLGLAIAKSIMGLQGGELKIEIDGDLFKSIVIFKE